MPHNYLLTGPPRIGKTTAVEAAVAALEERGLAAGGVYCPEIRRDGDRIGFEIVDVLTGESSLLAHVDRESGPSVGKYRVDIASVDERSRAAFDRALAEADFVVVDEIAPMEVHSDAFVRGVRRALDADVPVVGVLHRRSTDGFVGEVKGRADVTTFEVTPETRDELPGRLVEAVLAAREG